RRSAYSPQLSGHLMPLSSRLLVLVALATAIACADDQASPTDTYWASLSSLCGKAFAGAVEEGPAGDTAYTGKELVMHVRACDDSTILIPFHVGEDRSRTWVLTRTVDGLRLKHDHRHADGSEDQ